MDWYSRKFGSSPNYSELLARLATKPGDRQALLRSYFEPSEEEKKQGLKQPTKAHRAIADLVQRGYIRVIVTTNFDRLLESALKEVGVDPMVVYNASTAKGMVPLAHSKCTVIKPNGDYVHTGLRNTIEELEKYERSINKLLDQVFDEYGLIVCGWSAEWDTALRHALERAANRRYATFWTSCGGLGEKAQDLINARQAQVIEIKDADQFFEELRERVIALEDASRPHPLSKQAAVAMLKRYLEDDRREIQLHDFVQNEVEKVVEALTGEDLSAVLRGNADQKILQEIRRYESATDTLRTLHTVGSYWAKPYHARLWSESIERTANLPDMYVGLKLYPALLLMYSSGIAAVASRKFETLAAILTLTVRTSGDEYPLPAVLIPNKVLNREWVKRTFPEMSNRETPISDYLNQFLRDQFRTILPDDVKYDRAFDTFEYLLALVHLDTDEHILEGRFLWKEMEITGIPTPNHPLRIVDAMINEHRENWLLLTSGLFGGSLERLRDVKRKLDGAITTGGTTWVDFVQA